MARPRSNRTASDIQVPSKSRPAERMAMLVVALAAVLLMLRGIGHPYITYYDEAFHALVAKSLLHDPFKPVLNNPAWIEYDYRDWRENHVWLHKGILPLWQIALSYSILGVNSFALRLPSALLAGGAVLLTVLIGRRLLDSRSALIAAALQAINAFITWMVHGYWFSDHVDVALLFWVECGVYCLVRCIQSGAWRWAAAAGVAQGMAFLCKTYPALIVQAVALGAWVLARWGFGRRSAACFRAAHQGMMILATIVVIAPWTLWCALRFPREFFYELGHVGRHLYSDIEQWGAPWDRLIFDYAILIHFTFFTPILVAGLVLLRPTIRRRNLGLALLYTWGLGVLTPFLLAASKTPSSIVIGLPPLLLLLGALISRGLRGGRYVLAAWLLIVLAGLVYPVGRRAAEQGYPDPPVFLGVMRKELWVFWHVLAVVGLLAVLRFIAGRWRGPHRWRRRAVVSAAVAASIGTMVLAWRMAREQWEVCSPHPEQPSYQEISGLVKTRLPLNAALLVDRRYVGEHKVMQFFVDRTCYGLGPNWPSVAERLREAGAVPFVVSCKPLKIPAVFRTPTEGWAVYEYRSPVATRPAGTG